MTNKNIFDNIPKNFPEELFDVINMNKNVKIERIVSKGHSSPDGYWYDQEKDEFVIILKGKARLLFEGKKNILSLNTGDYISIPAHVKHRVEWTDPEQETVWLAVHY